MENKSDVIKLFQAILNTKDSGIRKLGCKLLKVVLKTLSTSYLKETNGLRPSIWKGNNFN